MNKTGSLILNVVLLIAVALLYYLHFSSQHPVTMAAAAGSDSTVSKPVVLLPKEIKASKIVYVNTDVLNEEYQYVKDLSDVAKANLQSLEAQYKKKATDFQNRYNEFQQKANQGLLSENQTRDAQEELGKRKEELDRMEGQQQQLMDQMQKDNEKVLKSIMDYIKDYNKSSQYNYVLAYSDKIIGSVLLANDSLDITEEIVNGLNEQYKTKKK
ncbi:MAG TPA: OmpH family outer membrane protein [Chitinophagales bacterium]|nr:OmpH family outer membrane protein [Chitinophagales bacterium]